MKRRMALLLLLPILLAGCKKEETATTGTTPLQAERTQIKTDGAKTTTVVVRITGLCTFVDRFDEPPTAARMPFDLHLINGRARDHLPVIVYHQDYASKDPTDRTVRVENKRHLFELRGERLSMMKVNGGASPLQYDEDEVTCKTLDKGSLAALPRLRHILQSDLTRANLHRDYVGPHLRWPSIAAVTDISFGTLKTYKVQPIQWRFIPRAGPASRHKQFLAQEVMWTFAVDGTTLTIQAARIGSDEPKDLVTLKADSKGEIRFTIANAARSDIPILLGTSYGHAPHRFDEHFTAYYDFLTVPRREDSRPRPEVFAVCDENDELTSDREAVAEVIRPRSQEMHVLANRNVVVLGGLNCGPDRLP